MERNLKSIMNKFVCLAILCFTVSLSLAHPGGFRFPAVRNTSSICANSTTAPLYLVQILTLVNNLQANATSNAVLQLRLPNFVAYVKNTTNQALISSNNCLAFVAGVKAANAADKTAERTRQQLVFDIQQRIRQVARNVTGSNGPTDVDSGEQHGHHF